MNTKHLVSIAALAVLLGASSASIAEYGSSPDQHPRESHDAATALKDAAVTTKVKARFLGSDSLKGADISVETTNDIVTLTGTAPTDDAKKAAEDIARQVEGVSSVDNQITISSSSKTMEQKTMDATQKTERMVSDSWITAKVKSSLLADSMTKGLNIEVKTTNKEVALSGTVGSQAEFDRAVQIASQTKGVQNVNTSALKVGRQ